MLDTAFFRKLQKSCIKMTEFCDYPDYDYSVQPRDHSL
jgi:hypothetical protein